MWPFSKKFNADGMPTEQQLELLGKCGIVLAPGKTLEGLKREVGGWGKHQAEIKFVLLALGNDFSDTLWHFDTECIEDDGAYKEIAERVMRLAGGALPLEKIEDHVDIESEEAWLSFNLDGKSYKWDFTVNDDWVDEAVFKKFVGLLDGRQKEKHFTYCDLQGQDCLFGCCTRAQLAELNRVTNMEFVWLR